MFSQLIQNLYILVQLRICIRVNNLYACQIYIQPVSTIHDLLFLTNHDDVCGSLFQNLCCCDQCSLVLGLRQYDCLLVLFCFCFNVINKCHCEILSPRILVSLPDFCRPALDTVIIYDLFFSYKMSDPLKVYFQANNRSPFFP